MKRSHRTFSGRTVRLMVFPVLVLALFATAVRWGGDRAQANHPVLVEGNCDSPVPGTTIVNIGQCGDYDGDGRIGTAEDTDGADRIFGTLKAALGPGTGAAAGTGANNNGSILIVRSGRFAEQLCIGNTLPDCPDQGTLTPGNVTIEAAPGVVADIDAVLQGDPAGGNTARQAGVGIFIYLQGPANNTVVTLRNLIIRNWREGIAVGGGQQGPLLVIDNCRFENNRDNGLHAFDFARVVVTRSQFTAQGRRIPVSGPSTDGSGILLRDLAQLKIADSNISHSAGPGINNSTSPLSAAAVTIFKVSTYFNNPNISGPFTVSPDHNYSF